MAIQFAALCCAYYGHTWLPYVIPTIYDCVGGIYLFLNSEPWCGSRSEQDESLVSLIHRLPDLKRKIHLVQGTWPNQEAQRNFTLAYAASEGYDYGFIVDTDEIYDTAQLQAMMRHVEAVPEVECWHMKWYTYWKSLRYVIDPMENYHPPVFVRLGTCGFVQSRNLIANVHRLIPAEIGVCHHMSYAAINEKILLKIHSFGHAPQVLPHWYDDVWLAWDDDHTLTNLHPVIPSQFLKAVEQPVTRLPPILADLATRNPNYPMMRQMASMTSFAPQILDRLSDSHSQSPASLRGWSSCVSSPLQSPSRPNRAAPDDRREE